MMLDHIGYDMFMINIPYDLAMKDDKNYRGDINVDRSLNWNITPLPDFFKEYYLCHAIYALYFSGDFALQDIAKINNIIVDIKMTCTDPEKMFSI